ncbi:hypothetical protein [Helicobacter rodentium]|uniref:hypothetical protein n=1 Tax=Helicobacter rodentium TaxID=59617 RepID=UPI0023F2CE78|nr:hypothetical protein [Helicobacter rodentium]
MRGIDSFADRLIMLTAQDIDNINKDSHIAYLKALYDCQNFVLVDLSHTPTLNKKTFIQNFGYKDDFYLSFLSNQDSISNEYLEARKALYKSISQIKQEKQKQELQELQKQQEILEQSLQNLDSKQKESQLKELQREQEKALRDKQRQEQQQARLNKHSNLILESQDKSIQIIFLDKNISMSHLLHIHNNKIDIFTQDKTYIDIQSLLEDYQDYGITQDILNSPSTQIFFYSALLLGSSEIETNPFLFGELDKDNTIKQDTPSYYFSPKDEENNLGTLLIFLNASTLTLLNYSLIDSSLNIKLELTNKESKEKQDKATMQREQKQHKEQLKPLSIAMLHPILEDNEMKCIHGGVVQLKSNLGKSIQDKNIPFILETDLLYSSIVGCPNPPISGGPCTQVALILPSSRGLKKHNEDYPIMQDLVSSGVFSDKGVPLVCITKPNKKIA